MNFVANCDGILRCGWTLPKQVGPAVIRNRLKRWSRVYFRHLLLMGEAVPVDVNLVFRKTETDFYKRLRYSEFAEILDSGWRQVKKRSKNLSTDHCRRLQNSGSCSSRRRLPV
jgi:ribonuclease P protein component